MKILLLSVVVLSMVGCAITPPAEEITQAPQNDISLAEVNKDILVFKDSKVRWGGRVLKTTEIGTKESPVLQVEVLEYPLDEKGKPMEEASSNGRFIAEVNGPYKRSQFFRGRLITISGVISGSEKHTLASGKEQAIPIVQSNEKFAWRRPAPDSYYHPSWYSNFYFGFHKRPYFIRTGYGIVFY
jgi:outer membrane lipoprotein